MKAVTRHRWLYLWLMPSLWLPCAVLSAFHPGDKGLSRLFATFPGEWLGLLNLNFGLSSVISRIAGAFMVVLIAGAIMDLMHISGRLCLFVLCAGAILEAAFVLKMWYFGQDFLFLLLCWLVYFVGAVSILTETGRRILRRLGRTKPSRATAGSAPSAASEPPEG